MPCRSDYPELTSTESELNTIFNIQDDLNGVYEQFRFPHPKLSEVECTDELLHKETSSLCEILRLKKTAKNYSFFTQKWWLDHQINDYKRNLRQRSANNPISVKTTSYDQYLLDPRKFMNQMLNEAFEKIIDRFDGFNESQNATWQRNITRNSFAQAMSSFELFSELLYFKLVGEELKNYALFKNYELTNDFWMDRIGSSFKDWLLFKDVFELQRYFEKYEQVVQSTIGARTYFNAFVHSTETSKNLVFTIADTMNLIRILLIVKERILGEVG